MAWTKTKIEKSTDNVNIVSAVATYNDATYGDFLYSEDRIDITNIQAAAAAFVLRANAAKDDWLTEETPSAKEVSLLTALNA